MSDDGSTHVGLQRTTFTDLSTIGELFIDGKFECYTLEPTCRRESGRKLAIPTGDYALEMKWSPRFSMDTPHLKDVPGHTFIEIHPGNKPEDTEDCILPGQTKDVDWVGSSRAAYVELVRKIEAKLAAGPVTLSITGSA